MRLSFILTIGALFSLAGCGGDEEASTCAESQLVGTTGVRFKVNDNTRGDEVGQSFQLSSDTTVDKVDLRLQKIGDITLGAKQVVVSLEAGGSSPGGIIISATLSTDEISKSSPQFYTFTFSTGQALTANTQYWITMRGDYTATGTEFVEWHGTTQTSYANGFAKYENAGQSAIWENPQVGDPQDLQFRVQCQ